MDIFFTLPFKLLPIYALIAIGYGLARMTGNITGPLAVLQIYCLTPIVIFTNVSLLKPTWTLAELPLLFFILCAGISTAVYLTTRNRTDGTGPLLAQASGTMNAGYFGVPVAVALFSEQFLPLYLLTVVACVIYENTMGYYFIARGRFSSREALIKLVKLPALYALIAGLMAGALHLTIPAEWQSAVRDCRGAYVALGSFIIGVGMAQVKKWEFDLSFFGAMMFIKIIIWPVASLVLLYLEHAMFGLLDPAHRPIILLLSLMPMAANTAAFAALLDIHPEKAATAVAASTLIALVTMPLGAILLGLV